MISPDEDERPASPFAYNFDFNPDTGQSTDPISLPQGARASTKIVNRKVNTCKPCQQAKRGCDRQRPCKGCIDRKMADQCSYAIDAEQPIDIRAVQKQLRDHERLFAALYNSLGISREKRDSITHSQLDLRDLRVEIPVLAERRRTITEIPELDPKAPITHMTVYSVHPTGPGYDHATKIFGSSSILLSMEGILGPWGEALEMPFRALDVNDPKATESSDNPDNIRVHLAASHSSLDSQGYAHSQNLAPVSLAFKLFLPPQNTPSSPREEPASSAIITPAHIAQLPSGSTREDLWNQFESMMVLHSGLTNPELKKRIDNMFVWAEWESSSQRQRNPHGRPSAPTLAFFSVACAAFAMGAQSRDCQTGHRAAAQRAAGYPTEAQYRSKAARATDSDGSSPQTSTNQRSNGHTPLNDNLVPERHTAEYLHALAKAARLTHDLLDLPASLDYVISHMLSWLYLLHPANVKSCVTDTHRYIDGGGPIQIDPHIWKEIGKVVNVARTMGLGIDPDTPMFGDALHCMGIWEKEMRRRTWWELCWFDFYISECLGQSPLIDSDLYDCRLPSDVDELSFGPTSTYLPTPIHTTASHSFSHCVWKSRLVKIAKSMKRYPLGPDHLETSINAARIFASEIKKWKASIPSHLAIAGLPDTKDDSWHRSTPNIVYPSTDIMAMQSCHLYTMADSLSVRLWTPFLLPTLGNPQIQQWPALACATAASAVVIASEHIRKTYRDLRPANLGSLVFGRSVFIAGSSSSAIAIRGGPDLHFMPMVVKTLRTALAICRDTTVCGVGKKDDKPNRFECGRVLELLLIKAERSLHTYQMGVGSKRKEGMGPRDDVLKLRANFELPYLVMGIVTISCTLRLLLDPIARIPPADPIEGANTTEDISREDAEDSRSSATKRPIRGVAVRPRTLPKLAPSESDDEQRSSKPKATAGGRRKRGEGMPAGTSASDPKIATRSGSTSRRNKSIDLSNAVLSPPATSAGMSRSPGTSSSGGRGPGPEATFPMNIPMSISVPAPRAEVSPGSYDGSLAATGGPPGTIRDPQFAGDQRGFESQDVTMYPPNYWVDPSRASGQRDRMPYPAYGAGESVGPFDMAASAGFPVLQPHSSTPLVSPSSSFTNAMVPQPGSAHRNPSIDANFASNGMPFGHMPPPGWTRTNGAPEYSTGPLQYPRQNGWDQQGR